MLDLTELPTGQARHSMGQLWGQLLRLRLARSLSDLSLSRNYPKGIPSWAQFHYGSWRTRDIIFQKIPIFA